MKKDVDFKNQIGYSVIKMNEGSKQKLTLTRRHDMKNLKNTYKAINAKIETLIKKEKEICAALWNAEQIENDDTATKELTEDWNDIREELKAEIASLVEQGVSWTGTTPNSSDQRF